MQHFRFSLILVLALIFPLSMISQEVQGKDKKLKIEGFVGKSPTVPAPGETVKLLEGDSGKVLDITDTNFFGKYKFDKLDPGYYIVEVGEIKREVMLKDKKKRLDIDLSDKRGSMDYAKAGMQANTGGSPVNAGPTDAALANSMAATYWGYSGSTESKIMLCPDGRFFDYSESSYSGTSNDSLGNETLAWGSAGQNSGQGSFSIQGTVQQGQLTIVYSNGNKRVLPYRATDNQGCYSFDGTQLCRSGPANCQ